MIGQTCQSQNFGATILSVINVVFTAFSKVFVQKKVSRFGASCFDDFDIYRLKTFQTSKLAFETIYGGWILHIEHIWALSNNLCVPLDGVMIRFFIFIAQASSKHLIKV